MHYADPVSLYIITQPNDKARLRPLVRIVVNMIVRLLADKMEFENGRPKATYKHKLLAMIDEFPALGKLENSPGKFSVRRWVRNQKFRNQDSSARRCAVGKRRDQQRSSILFDGPDHSTEGAEQSGDSL